ncbi:MAG: PadR family transcriptional regulator [Acidimicrobiales bacterium]
MTSGSRAVPIRAGDRRPARAQAAVVRDFLRGATQVHVLHHAVEHDVYGAWLTDELSRHGYVISPGTLYPLLHRMEAEGLLASRVGVDRGRALRLYRATEQGRRELGILRKAVAELAVELLPGIVTGRWTGVQADEEPSGPGPAGSLGGGHEVVADE